MRLRGGLAAALAAGLTIVATAVPASAGTGASQACNDGHGYQEVPVNNGIVTLGAQIGREPTQTQNYVVVCFSNTVPGVPSTATGGAFWLVFGKTGGTTAPSVYANLYCDDDLGPQTVDLANAPFSHCDYDNGVSVQFSLLQVTPPGCLVYNPRSGTCLLSDSGTYLPVPAISVTVLNNRVL